MSERRGALSSKEIARYAKKKGFNIETGRGNHGKYLVAPNGSRRPLPDHGRGIISVGVRFSLLKFIEQYNLGDEEAA